jgi:uracil-DNA glycosylase
MSLFNPCISAIGPKDARILACGEAPGEQEEFTGIPFIGASGQEFDRLLEQAGLHRRDLYLTNLLFTRPPANNFDAFCLPRKELSNGYSLPAISSGKYLHPDLLCEHSRLLAETKSIKPNLILALGAKALWAFTGLTSIAKLRGTIIETPYGKVLPTYHPAYLFRDWGMRPVLLADLLKAEVESHFPEIRRPQRHVFIDPSLKEVQDWEEEALSSALLSVDTETYGGTITCIGFANSPYSAIVIPFFDRRKPTGSYWSLDEELEVRKIIHRVLASPVSKVLQNGLYDIQYLLREGYRPRNIAHDTMIRQHALYPEMPKNLAFLGSIHTNDIAWKLLRPRGEEALKRED